MTEIIEIKEDGNVLTFPIFENIKVSTKTFIIMTNLKLNIEELYNRLPITDYAYTPRRRGRRKKNEVATPVIQIDDGSIITLEYKNNIRGVNLKKKKKTVTKANFFRNALTVVIMIDSKKINFKVSNNGKIQMTGCKEDKHCEQCIKWLWFYIKDTTIYEFQTVTKILKIIFIPAMRNIDFSLHFNVDREKLDEYFNQHTKYHSLLETSFGYTGVNIKIPLCKPIHELMLKSLEYINDEWSTPTYVQFADYLNMLSEKDIAKKLKKKRYNTFLIFHSGKIIMSGMEETFMKESYYDFIHIITKCYHQIKEKLK